MIDRMHLSHQDTPYGWWLWAVAGTRLVRRVFGQAPGLRDPDATALSFAPPPAARRPGQSARPCGLG